MTSDKDDSQSDDGQSSSDSASSDLSLEEAVQRYPTQAVEKVATVLGLVEENFERAFKYRQSPRRIEKRLQPQGSGVLAHDAGWHTWSSTHYVPAQLGQPTLRCGPTGLTPYWGWPTVRDGPNVPTRKPCWPNWAGTHPELAQLCHPASWAGTPTVLAHVA